MGEMLNAVSVPFLCCGVDARRSKPTERTTDQARAERSTYFRGALYRPLHIFCRFGIDDMFIKKGTKWINGATVSFGTRHARSSGSRSQAKNRSAKLDVLGTESKNTVEKKMWPGVSKKS